MLDVPLDLKELVRYPWFLVPPSLATPDGFFNKTNKAAMLHALVPSDNDTPLPSGAFYISDGNALFHSLTNFPPTTGGICKQLLSIMVEKGAFLFSTDSYHGPIDSVKTSERIRRGVSQRYIIEGPATKRPPDLKLFLSNDDNKKQLCELVLKVWSSPECSVKLSKVRYAFCS